MILPAFGANLQQWRTQRGLSQMALGLEAGVSARHISFLETGRAGPSAEMVLRLSRALDLPLRERNALLVSAGFAPRFGHRPLDDGEMAQALAAARYLLEAHEPFPALALDRLWRIVLCNRPQAYLFRDLADEHGSLAHVSVLDLVFAPGPFRDSFVNWEEVAVAVLRRLRRQVQRAGRDREIRALWERVVAAPGVDGLIRAEPVPGPAPALVPIQVREGDRTLTWLNTLASFGASGDVTLEELVIESFYPGDEETRAYAAEIAKAARGRRP